MELPGGRRMHKKGKQACKLKKMELPDRGKIYRIRISGIANGSLHMKLCTLT